MCHKNKEREMNDGFRSILPSAVVLGAAAVTALYLTLSRGWAEESRTHIRGAVRVVLVAIFFQAGHFVEELSAGFHEQLPALFGLPPMPLQFFVSFNVAWLIIWSISTWGLTVHSRASLFPLWFLGIGCAMNGVAHPALSILAGGYFPGLLTSPVVGILGVILLRRLRDITHAVASSPNTA
jgi:hypothetical protein